MIEQTVGTEAKFRDMAVRERLLFCAKLLVFFGSFGFVFPTILSD